MFGLHAVLKAVRPTLAWWFDCLVDEWVGGVSGFDDIGGFGSGGGVVLAVLVV